MGTNENQYYYGVYTHIKEKIYLYLIMRGGLDSNPLNLMKRIFLLHLVDIFSYVYILWQSENIYTYYVLF